MRKIIAALQVSLDGFIEGPNGELDWIDTWEDPFDLLPQIDTCILGGGMYPGYEQYWSAVLAHPHSVLPLTGKPPSPGEVTYARFAARAEHLVLSGSLERVTWHNARIIRDIEAIRSLKQQPGKDMHAVGGASLVSSLINRGLVDELRLAIRPIVLGGGKALFGGVTSRHALELREVTSPQSGRVRLTYGLPA
jgi:dihydrofolate reductase